MWRLNKSRSNIPAITKSQILTIQLDGDSVTMHDEIVNDQDQTLVISLSGKLDGKDYPVSGTPFADTVSFQRTSPRVIEGIAKKDGQVRVRETAVLSESGESVCVTYLSYDDQGHTTEYVGYFERT